MHVRKMRRFGLQKWLLEDGISVSQQCVILLYEVDKKFAFNALVEDKTIKRMEGKVCIKEKNCTHLSLLILLTITKYMLNQAFIFLFHIFYFRRIIPVYFR